MRIVAISDLHADKDTLGVPRYEEVARAFGDASTYATSRSNDERTDVLVCLGDIADPDNGGATLRAVKLVARQAFELAHDGVDVILLAGNHDVCEDGTGMTCLSPIAPIQEVDIQGDGYRAGHIHVVERPCAIEIKGVRFLCLPYVATSHSYDPETTAAAILANARASRGELPLVVLSHLMIPGIMPGEETTEMPRGRDVVFPFQATRGAALRLSGHYHRRQTFDPCDGGPPIHVVGSACRLTFGEQDNDPAFLVIDL